MLNLFGKEENLSCNPLELIKMLITLRLDEKEIKTQLAKIIKDILQQEVSMRWVKEIIEDEIRKKVKIDISLKKEK